MAIALDQRNTGAAATGVSSLSYSATVSSGLCNSMLVVGVGMGAETETITSVVWDSTGSPMPLINTINGVAAMAVSTGRAYLWFRMSPSAGTKTITVTASFPVTDICSGCESISNVNQISPFNSASPQNVSFGANTNPSTTVTSASGEWVIDCCNLQWNLSNPNPSPSAGQTQIFDISGSGDTFAGFGSDELATGGATTMSWTGLTGAGSTLGANQVSISIKPCAITEIAWKIS